MLKLFLCFALALAFCRAQCSEGCEQGDCVGGVCKCRTGWIGNDCSVPLTDLVSGESVQAAVEINSWNYYRIQVPGGALSVTLLGDAGSPNSDCDLFVKYSKLPTAYDYDGRDTGWGSNAHVEIKDAAAGDWYIGVFGSMSKGRYTLYAVVEGNCPGGCSNNGNCVKGANGSYGCACNPGYTGDHCNEFLSPNPIAFNSPFEGHTMASNAWTNYFFEAKQQVLKLDVIINITSTTLCDFYINKAHAPDFTHWQYISPDNERNFAITMQEVQVGTWFIGVFTGQATCTYTITLKTENVRCTGQCSNRGNCGPPCNCNKAYTGDYCEYRSASLTNGATDGGFVDTNLFHYYKYPSNSNNDINIHIEQAANHGDCDLYIKHNSPPTLQDYDEMDISNSTSYDLLVTDALQDVIYIAVFGYEACTYTITTTEIPKDDACQNGKSCIHGTCQGNDGCVCFAGWVGDTCANQATELTNGKGIRGVITEQNQWQYFHYSLKNPTFLVTLKERTSNVNTAGFLYLLMSQDAVPNLREHDFANYSPTNGFHTITTGLDGHPASDFPLHYVIAVYGSAFVHEPVEYDLVVWEPDF